LVSGARAIYPFYMSYYLRHFSIQNPQNTMPNSHAKNTSLEKEEFINRLRGLFGFDAKHIFQPSLKFTMYLIVEVTGFRLAFES